MPQMTALAPMGSSLVIMVTGSQMVSTIAVGVERNLVIERGHYLDIRLIVMTISELSSWLLLVSKQITSWYLLQIWRLILTSPDGCGSRTHK